MSPKAPPARGDRLEPFHLAVPSTCVPPAVSKSPPAKRAGPPPPPSSNTARALTDPRYTPGIPPKVGRHSGSQVPPLTRLRAEPGLARAGLACAPPRAPKQAAALRKETIITRAFSMEHLFFGRADAGLNGSEIEGTAFFTARLPSVPREEDGARSCAPVRS